MIHPQLHSRRHARFSWPAIVTLGIILSSCTDHSRKNTLETAPPAAPRPEVQQEPAPQPVEAAAAPAKPPEPAKKTTVEVLMINGGGNRTINYQSHLIHLKQLNKLLLDSGIPKNRITIMSADGSDPAADMAVREERPEPDSWMLDGTDLEKYLRAQIEFKDSKIDGVDLQPATREGLNDWFKKAAGRLRPGDTLFLYVTDHGTKNNADPANNRITLWGRDESLEVAELRKLLAQLDPGVRVVQLMSQCYSGAFADLMYRQAGDLLPSGKVCGFFSSTRERPAYGCYPETRDKENVGHSFRFIEALAGGHDFAGAHREVLAGDDTPDVPIRTSDVYLESLLRESSRRRGVPPDIVIDELLHEAWRDAAKWETEIRLLDRISESFGYFSPRFLTELDRHSDALDKVSRAFDTYGRSWDEVYRALNRENLQRFLADNPGWAGSVRTEALDRTDPELRRSLMRRLADELGSYTRTDRATLSRMELLRQRNADTAKAHYRMEVRQGVVLRLRTLLTSIAGRVYLDRQATAEQRQVYQALSSSESFALSGVRKSAPAAITIRTFPSYDQELELGKTILPGWMGVQFAQVSRDARNRYRLGSGAVEVTAVNQGSPAQAAGLAPGDIITGTPDEAFSGSERVREWVMTAPVGVSRPLMIQRGEQRFQVRLMPMPEPINWPEFPGPVKVGSTAPALDSLRPYRGTLPAEGSGGGSYLLFFFATWCGPCKASLPELALFERERNTPIIAVTDEPSRKLDPFFEKQKGFFPQRVMTDEQRQAFLAYGVNGVPTFVLVDRGRVRSIAVGYRADLGLRIEGWSAR